MWRSKVSWHSFCIASVAARIRNRISAAEQIKLHLEACTGEEMVQTGDIESRLCTEYSVMLTLVLKGGTITHTRADGRTNRCEVHTHKERDANLRTRAY